MLERGRTGDGPAKTHRSAALAAILSFLIPGLGQAYAGHKLRGLVISVPQFVVIGVLVALFLRSPAFLAGLFLQHALWVAVLNVGLLVYRALAVVDAYRTAQGQSESRSGPRRAVLGLAALSLLLVADVAVHGAAAYASYLTYDTTLAVFSDDGDANGELPTRGRATATPAVAPTEAPGPTTSSGTPDAGGTVAPSSAPPPSDEPIPTAEPTAVPAGPYWADDGRLDLLLLGADEGPGRWGLRPDAIHVASVDVATGRSSLVAIPRYIHHVPLPPETADSFGCLCFPTYLNAIYTYALDHPNDWPGGDNRGIQAVSGAVEAFLDVKLDGIVVVNLNGFVDAIDAIGGIDMYVPEGVYDEYYVAEDGVTTPTIDIAPGGHHFDGHTALMYVRSRHQDGDYARLGRQQIFLRALQDELTACRVLTHLPDLLRSLKDVVRTDVPLEEVPALLELLDRTHRPRRISLTEEVGFSLDQRDVGAVEMVREAVRTAFEPGPDQGPELPPEPSGPPDQGGGC